MLEGKGNVVCNNDCIHAIKTAAKECQKIIEAIESLRNAHGKVKRTIEPVPAINEDISESIRLMSEMRLREIFSNQSHDKISRDNAVNEIRDDVVDRVWSANADVDRWVIQNQFNHFCKSIFRTIIFENGRCDGRAHKQLRDISCQVNMYKPLHGCSLFQRGQTQVLSTVSLDSIESALKLDTLSSIDM